MCRSECPYCGEMQPYYHSSDPNQCNCLRNVGFRSKCEKCAHKAQLDRLVKERLEMAKLGFNEPY